MSYAQKERLRINAERQNSYLSSQLTWYRKEHKKMEDQIIKMWCAIGALIITVICLAF